MDKNWSESLSKFWEASHLSGEKGKYEEGLRLADSIVLQEYREKAFAVLKYGEVCRLAEAGKFDTALPIAHSVNLPCYKTRAFAMLAHRAPNRNMALQMVHLSFSAALGCNEPSQIVEMSAYPLFALLELDFIDEIPSETKRLLNVIEKEPHPVRKGWAVSHLVFALMEDSRVEESFTKLFRYYLKICQSAYSWRLDMTCRRMVSGIHQFHKKLTPALLDCIRNPKTRKRAEREIQ